MEDVEFETTTYKIPDEIDFSEPMLMNVAKDTRRKSTIICSLATPNITSVEIQKMMETGMNVVKFKAAHFTKEEKIKTLRKVHHAAQALCKKYGIPDWPISTCLELRTCSTKTGILADDIEYENIEEGSEVIVTNNVNEFDQCSKRAIFIDNKYLKENAKVGNEISIKEDNIILKIIEIIDDRTIKCLVTHGGKLFNMESVSLRCVDYAEPMLSSRDYELLQFCMDYQIDMLVINYVRSAETLKKIKTVMKDVSKRPVLLAGICTQQCLNNVNSIIKEADGLLLSREILTYELPNEQKRYLHRIQKMLSATCLKAGKYLYISGGVFEEGVKNGVFYDCEVFDVANALLDGVSGFFLRDCSDSDYVIHAIKLINEICGIIEPFIATTSLTLWRLIEQIKPPVNAAKAVAMSCLVIADQCSSKAIIVPTVSGVTAKSLLELQPNCVIYTVSTNRRVLKRLATFRGVVPLLYLGSKFNKQWSTIIQERVNYALEYVVKKGLLKYGDSYVTLHRGKDHSAFCDTVQVWAVSFMRKTTVECPDNTSQKH